MKISEVSKCTGLSASNIRFYEKKGLLSPARDQDSKYRDYTPEDISRLKVILLYRKTGLSIDAIHALFSGQENPADSLRRQEAELLDRIEMLNGALELCRRLQKEENMKNIDVDFYLNYVASEEHNGKKFAGAEELLDDFSDFTKISLFRGDPYIGRFFRNPWTARILSLVLLILLVAFPAWDILTAILSGDPIHTGRIVIWPLLLICLPGGFLFFRSRK